MCDSGPDPVLSPQPSACCRACCSSQSSSSLFGLGGGGHAGGWGSSFYRHIACRHIACRHCLQTHCLQIRGQENRRRGGPRPGARSGVGWPVGCKPALSPLQRDTFTQDCTRGQMFYWMCCHLPATGSRVSLSSKISCAPFALHIPAILLC